jgi:hypothetical protein
MGTWLVMIEMISKLKGNIIVATSKHGFLASSVKYQKCCFFIKTYETLLAAVLSQVYLVLDSEL